MEFFMQLFPGIGTFFAVEPVIAVARIVLIVFGFVLACLGFKRTLEPLIMVPMGIGMMAVNCGMMFLTSGTVGNLLLDPLVSDASAIVDAMQVNFLQPIYNLTFSNGLIACLVFMGIGARSEISFLLAKPWSSMIIAIFAEMGTFAALAAGGLSLALALPCWWLLRPALGVPLGWLQPAAQRVESAALSTAITWLPRVSGGRLNIQVEAAAGGVADGALSQGGGIQVSGVTDLALTASDKPKETVYLRGFIGGSYDGTTWQAPDADAFDSAAMNWKTEDNARLTIASLPFLRTAYDGTAQPQTLTVERIHADTQYTYAPYNAYWGDYYTIQGDGAAAGQTAQDDVFLYYPRDTAQTQLEARADADPSVLDRMEASYAAYAASRYTAVPDGYDELQTLCDEAKKDQKLTEAVDIGDYIRAYLNTNYQYNASAPQPPEGADPIRYFLTESKQGYSVQFASAAVVMFRMFGLPARYVVGYAAPQSLFTQQEDGSWHAILQDDNAHAWAEVYISGQGWTPMEMTPGVLVSAQQADLRTDPLPETQGQDTAPAAGESSANEPAATIVPRSRLVLAALLGGCLLAAVVLLVLARRHAMGYGRGSCNARVLAVFGSIYRLLVRRGLPPDTPSDAPEFAAFLQSCVPALEPQDAEALLALAQAAQFGAGTMTEQDTDKMRKLYQVIKHTGKRKQSQKSVEKQSQE